MTMLKIGVDKTPLAFPDGLGLAGYGPLAGAGYNAKTAADEKAVYDNPGLFVRTMVLQTKTAEGTKQLVFVGFMELWAGSMVVHRRVVERLVEQGTFCIGGEPVTFGEGLGHVDHRVLIMPSHTHSGPGHYSGNRIFDTLLMKPAGFREDVVEIIVEALFKSFNAACTGAVAAELGISSVNAYGLGRNRSLEAFVANFDHRTVWPDPALEVPTAGEVNVDLSIDEHQAVDPRMWTAWAFKKGTDEPIGTFAIAPVHNVALGRDYKYYHPDWGGYACALMEVNTKWAALAQGPAGDVTSIPVYGDMHDMGIELAKKVAAQVAKRWQAGRSSACQDKGAVDVELGFYRFRPDDLGLAVWDIGTPVLNGSEESRSCWYDESLGEARRLHKATGIAQKAYERIAGTINRDLKIGYAAQRPKEPALGVLQPLLRRVLDLTPGDEHPLHLLRFGTHLFFGLPSEVTTVASWEIERALLEGLANRCKGKPLTASPLAMVNDYMGYLTTAKEYDKQNYEGAMNIFGRDTHETMTDQLVATAVHGDRFRVDPRRPNPLPRVLTAEALDDKLRRGVAGLSLPVRWLMRRLFSSEATP